MSKTQTKSLNAILSAQDLVAYCPDLANWPTSWCYEDRDLIPGEQIVAVLKPFILDLLSHGLSRKTRNLHSDNLWVLGSEIIRDFSDTSKLRKRAVKELILDAVAGDEAPLIHGNTPEQDQRSFDSTCKEFNRFLTARNDI